MRYVGMVHSLRAGGDGRAVKACDLVPGFACRIGLGSPVRTLELTMGAGVSANIVTPSEAIRWAESSDVVCLEPQLTPEAFVVQGLLDCADGHLRFDPEAIPASGDRVLLLDYEQRWVNCHRSERVLADLRNDPAKTIWLLLSFAERGGVLRVA